jgi:Ca-activated chloride channel family protein
MNRTKIILTVSLFGIILFSLTHQGYGEQGYGESEHNNTLSPYFFIENGDPSVDRFPLRSTDVSVNINGVIAHVVVTQKYQNEGTRPINARYIFPASTRAAVHGMKMRIGDETITARIQEKKEAQRKFDKAKREGKSASLLKQHRPNVFSMNVANIMPGDIIHMELRYTELLVPTNGTYEFVYPTVVGPRYSGKPEKDAPESEKWIKNPYLKEGSAPRTKFNIVTTISTGIPLYEVGCKSHKTDILWQGKTVAKIMLADPYNFGGNRDYILNYRLTGKKIESGLMLYEGADENFFLLMVQPPENIKQGDIPPREYIFVVDISGSMHGFPLNTSKKLLRNLIGNLRSTDTFNVVLFAGSSSVMAPSSLTASKENINRAIRLIDNQRGGGGTELLSAFKRALALPRDEKFSRSVIVVTDGYIAAEKEVFELIHENLNRTNVFSFGIGSSVNRYLIEGMAKAGLGEPFIVTRPNAAHDVAERFRDYIQSPVLTNITVKYDGFDAYDVQPAGIPDLFAKRPIVLFGKWRGRAKGTIALSGMSAKRRYKKSFNVSKTRPLEMNSGLRYLWARKRIELLSDFNFGRRNRENKAEVTTLGLTYNLLTAYTSFIAVHEVIRNPDGKADDVDQPLPLPLHVSNLAVGGTVGAVPEPELFILFVIGAMILITGYIYKRRAYVFVAHRHVRNRALNGK